MKKFILLSTQRTGSSWLLDLLSSHPSIKGYEELFLPGKEVLHWAGALDALPWDAYLRRQSPLPQMFLKPLLYFRYLDSIYTPNVDAVKAVGFKLMYSQLRTHPPVLPYLLFRHISVIHLVRENFLDLILSREAKKLRGLAHSQSEVNIVSITIDTSRLLRDLEWNETKVRRIRNLLKMSGLPILEVTYEDLVNNEMRQKDVLGFLQVAPSPHKLNSSLQKLNRSSHRDLISNYDDVSALLRKTRFARLLR